MSSHIFETRTTLPQPIISHGQGPYLFDVAGHQYIDACSGAIAANLGHGLEEIARAGYEQAVRVAFAYRSQFRNVPAERLAQKLVSLAPEGLRKVYFVNSGSEATEFAVRLALQYWQIRKMDRKRQFLSRKISYHGMTLGALGVSGHFQRRRGYDDLLWASPQVAASYCYRCPFRKQPEHCDLECAEDLERAILEVGPENVAAFIAEPIVGAAGGALVPKEGYFGRIRDICNRFDVLLVIDEVLTGLGRTGRWFAISDFSVSPDLLLLGKGLGAGYTPMGAVMMSEEIASTLRGSSSAEIFGHTYGGNPQSAAIALAVIEFIETHALVKKVQELGLVFESLLRQMVQHHPIVGDVRGKGFLWGIELVRRWETNASPEQPSGLANDLTRLAFDVGLLVYPSQFKTDILGDAIMLAPPFVSSEQNLREIVQRLNTCLAMLEHDVLRT